MTPAVFIWPGSSLHHSLSLSLSELDVKENHTIIIIDHYQKAASCRNTEDWLWRVCVSCRLGMQPTCNSGPAAVPNSATTCTPWVRRWTNLTNLQIHHRVFVHYKYWRTRSAFAQLSECWFQKLFSRRPLPSGSTFSSNFCCCSSGISTTWW